ncbi:hypothetical protein QUG71_20525, partial [Enterobacter asburiae]|uniref:hypothetical protein n=1 Tax=Enterobacter asburiae TaxID=61645 RepID=UPI0025A03AF8
APSYREFSFQIFFDTSFAVRRNFWCLLYRAEYKYSGLVWGKFGICEGDSGNRVLIREMSTHWQETCSTHLFQITDSTASTLDA